MAGELWFWPSAGGEDASRSLPAAQHHHGTPTTVPDRAVRRGQGSRVGDVGGKAVCLAAGTGGADRPVPAGWLRDASTTP